MNHVVLQRTSNEVASFMNGVKMTPTAFTGSVYGISRSNIGGDQYHYGSWIGKCDIYAVRVTIGVARYGASFTPTYKPFATHG